MSKPSGFPVMTTALQTTCLVVAVIGFAAMAGLVDLGRWQGDEFSVAVHLRENGFWSFFKRLVTWSPRPLSEAYLAVYLRAADIIGRPMIGLSLGILWAMVPLAVVAAVLRSRSADRLTVATVLSACTVTVYVGANKSDALYWIAGAAAYVPTIAAVIAAHGYLMASRMGGGRCLVPMLIACLVAACSSETGLFLSLAFSALALVHASGLIRKSDFDRREAIWASSVLAASLVLLVMLAMGRGSQVREGVNGVSGDVVASAISALGLLVSAPFQITMTSAAGSAVGLIVLVGTALSCAGTASSGIPARIVGAWVISLLFAAFATMFTGLYKIGLAGSDRHVAMVAVYVCFAMSAAGLLVSAAFRKGKWHRAAGALLLGTASAASIHGAAQSLTADYMSYGTLHANQHSIWRSGHGEGDTLVVPKQIKGKIIGGFDFLPPVGSYTRSKDDPWDRSSVYDYFGKERLEMKDSAYVAR